MKYKDKIMFIFIIVLVFILSFFLSDSKVVNSRYLDNKLEPNEEVVEEDNNEEEEKTEVVSMNAPICPVTFKDKDGTILYTVDDLVCGSTVSYNGPTLGNEDYEFAGWYRDSDYNEAFNLESNVESELVLFAKYNFIERAQLITTTTEINYGSIVESFDNDIQKSIKIKNTGNVNLTLSINNPTSTGPFGSLDFPVNQVIEPNQEKTITLIAKSGGTNSDKVGIYYGDYVITGESESGQTISITIPAKIEITNSNVGVIYTTHVQNIGWQDYVSNGQVAGTSGRSLRLEGIKIQLTNHEYEGNIEYRTHIQNIGWESSYKRNGAMSGTTGMSYRLEGIEIRLTGKMAEHYDVYYRVHAQSFGWLGWARNGERAGTSGFSYRLEAIEIKLVKKGTKVNDYGNKENFVDSVEGKITPISEDKLISYSTHVQNIGWQGFVTDGMVAGTSGQSLRLEGIKIKLENQKYSGSIEYRTHIQNLGWELSYRKDGAMSGTSGRNLRLEGIEIRLTGEMAEHYDVYYRVHAQSFGWLGWARNGERAGTSGFGYRLEAVEIKLIEKGKIFDDYGEKETFIDATTGKVIPVGDNKMLSYSTHVQNIGWQTYVTDGMVAGTSGQSLRIEGIKIRLNKNNFPGDIEYRTNIQNIGWESTYKKNDEISGTIGKSYRIEAIEIRLTGEMADHYDIYYRVHAEHYGWLGWSKNGEPAGTEGFGYRLEAIEIKVVTKNKAFNTGGKSYYRNDRFETDSKGVRYIFADDSFADDWITINGTKYFFNSLGYMIAENAKKIIDVSYHDGNIDWSKVKRQGDVDGAMIRVAYRGNTIGAIVNDTRYYDNIVGATQQNIPVGVYFYSQAITVEEAQAEALHTLSIVESMGGKSKITLPIVIDTEYTGRMENGVRVGRADNLTKAERTDVVLAFMQVIEDAGYDSMVYSSTNFLYENLDMNRIGNKKLWIAQYNHYCTYKGPGQKIMWQYSSTEKIPGISTDVDVSVMF